MNWGGTWRDPGGFGSDRQYFHRSLQSPGDGGQLDLFGGGLIDEQPMIVLPFTARMSKTEQLDWEKELLGGLYVSDHPINSILKQIKDKITHFPML